MGGGRKRVESDSSHFSGRKSTPGACEHMDLDAQEQKLGAKNDCAWTG